MDDDQMQQDPPSEPSGVRARATATTRAKIILAAERLFAIHGIAAVSLREIAAQAGQGNSNAVRYHFGDKDNLLQSVFEYRTLQFEPMRLAMLETAERQGRSRDIVALLQMLFLPYLTATDPEGRHTYAGFIAQYVTHARAGGAPYRYDQQDEQAPGLRRIRASIVERLGFLPDYMVRPRVQAALQAFTGAILRWDSQLARMSHDVPLRTLVIDVINQIAISITMPFCHDDTYFFLENLPSFETIRSRGVDCDV